MFSKHDIIMPRGMFDLVAMQKHISRILNAAGPNYMLINAYGQQIQVSKAEVDSRWFSLFSPGKTLAPYESQVMMTAVMYPGGTVSQLLINCPILASTQKVRGALERIRKKGFPCIDNFLLQG